MSSIIELIIVPPIVIQHRRALALLNHGRALIWGRFASSVVHNRPRPALLVLGSHNFG
jgi:hypothetical protein